MSGARDVDVELEDWQLLTALLRSDWRELAHETGALRRCRGFDGPDTLLRTLLLHIGPGLSLRETAVRARSADWTTVSDVAIFKRLRSSEEWLRRLATGLLAETFPEQPKLHGYEARMVDATVVNEPGSSGTSWRLHYSIRLSDLRCDFFEFTDPSGGESYRRFPVSAGDLIVGDRAYATAPGIQHVHRGGGRVLVRMKVANLPLRLPSGRDFPLLARLRKLRIGEIGEWEARCVLPEDGEVVGRVCAVRKSKAAAQRSARKQRRSASKEGRRLQPKTIESVKYQFVFTTAASSKLSAETILEIYRLRWQIELSFKRLKSLVGLGHLPKRDPACCRAWIYGKLLVALLAEKLAFEARFFSPWGYRLKSSQANQAHEAPPHPLS